MQFENNNKNKPLIELPKGFEEPNHPDHELYLYLQANTQLRENIQSQHQIVIQPEEENNNDNEINTMEEENDYINETFRIPNPGESFRVTETFISEQKQLFQQEKIKYNQQRQQLQSNSTQKLPSFTQWKEKTTKEPSIDYLLSFSNLQLIELVNYCQLQCKVEITYSIPFIKWLYFLLLLLETPLDMETQSLLSSILKYICRARHALFDPSDPLLIHYNQIITIIGIIYGQSTEEDML